MQQPMVDGFQHCASDVPQHSEVDLDRHALAEAVFVGQAQGEAQGSRHHPYTVEVGEEDCGTGVV